MSSRRTAPAPPSPLPTANVHIVPAGEILHRNHLSSFGPREFNPCKGGLMRFSPIEDDKGRCVPSLYGATTREAAAYESIFHDIEPSHPFKTVRLDVVTERSVSRLETLRDLSLAALFAPDLQLLGTSRAQLIETSRSSYFQTLLWAQAIHHAMPKTDGLIWTSRRCDPAQCVVLFGDRVAEADLDVLDCIEVATSPATLLALHGYGKRAGIVLVT